MEVKKNPNYDLEKKRGLFLQIGFLVSLLVVLMAFEYETPVEKIADLEFEILDEMDEVIPITVQDKPKPKELPKFKPIELTTIILADDEEDVVDLDLTDSDAFEDDSYDIADVTEEIEEVEDVPFVRVEQMPIFNPKKNKTYDEGVRDLFVTMQKMTKYPVVAMENGIEGKVFVRFVVTKTGKVDNVEVMRKGDPALDNEAIRVVRNLPNFKPGMQRNKPVSVWFSGYISFVLQ
ncbi:energy transducer TonB [Labilibaculum sp. DW002]|uniref:Energy transducer TonB n=1 Tax=Paralabilibaculum antarcticum TaxID=2912572 RepID=A0ABT5VX07_9BACT|nr:energy transducer TonB [Labilibaculum sp. DW002]MDE5419947.1 energy transducer TonB [Labilibaculum sp. DW002]